jgi:hypothetical protein
MPKVLTTAEYKAIENRNKKEVKIQNNEFNCESKPTTQEDNFGQINNKWDLFRVINVDGPATKVGHLVEYMNGDYAVFHLTVPDGVRYDFPKSEIKFY